MPKTAQSLLIAALILATALTLTGVGVSLADKGGCPNDSAANGAGHANENSAHAPEKQTDRGCTSGAPAPGETTPTPAVTPSPEPTASLTPEPTPIPTPEVTSTPEPTAAPEPTPSPSPEPTPEATATPEPTPTPTPVPNADVEVVTVTLLAPVEALAGVPLQLTAQTFVRNNGPVSPAIVDTTFTPTLPSDCSATSGVMTVQNSVIPSGTSTFLSRSWMVTCVSPGVKAFEMTVMSVLDPLIPAVDPDPGNNTMSVNGSTQVN